jgi:hypothetical protein
MMGESQRLGHFVGTDLLRRSSVTVRRRLAHVNAQYRQPPLLSYKFSWEHLQVPAEVGRLEEFNQAVRRFDSDHRMDTPAAASHGVERKRKADEICQEVEVAAVAMESVVGQVASVVVIAAAAQSEISGGLERRS